MSLTASDITQMLQEYVKSPEGKAELKKQGMNITGYSESKMKEIASELREIIINAYLSIVKDPGKYFNIKATKVNEPREQKDGTWKLTISFSDKALSRRSLYSDWGTSKKGTTTGFTGSGVDDIFALFSMGYSARTNVWGTWWDNQSDSGDRGELGLIRSRRSRPANRFISDAIQQFNVKYPDVIVLYPSEWGGTL